MKGPILAAATAAILVQFTSAQQLVGIKAGVNPTTGERPARLNIEDLQGKGPAWDLFIQALASIEDGGETDWLSWYQIAGIHGIPFKAYNGVNQVPNGAADAGYCPHGQVTFITWHRPYLALLEQTLQQRAADIAKNYTGSSAAAYKAAAETLRWPYWDWAISGTLPKVTTDPEVKINLPSGSETVRNPLYSYKFKTFPFKDPDFQGQDLSQFSETKRCVDNKEGSDGVNHIEIINDRLGGATSRLRGQVYAVFTANSSFEAMASTQSGGGSFENPHNTVHQEIGGGPIPGKNGHMRPVAWSGFDPIFWLHHANVDRHFAMWQAIYHTKAMFTSSQSGMALFGTAAGPVTADTPLKPFLDDKNEFWTSKRSTSTRAFGYTYPGVEDWGTTPEELAKRVMAEVNRLYGPKAKAAAISAGDGQRKEYSAEIKVDRADSALPLPGRIEVYLNNNTLAGEYSLLGMPKAGDGFASIPLQLAMEESRLDYVGKPAADVVAVLKERIRIVVKNDTGANVAPTAIRSLEVQIQDWDYTPAKADDQFPVYSAGKKWPVTLK